MLRLRAQRAAWLILGCVAGLIGGCGRDASPSTTPVTGDNGDASTVDGNGGNAGGAGGGNSGAGGGRAVEAGGACVDCLIDADCPIDSPVCTPGHTCSDSCAADTDCQDGPAVPGNLSVCDPRSHLCVDCLRNSDCGADSYCRADGTCG